MYYKGINLTHLNDYEIYDLVLERKIPNFPPGYWCSISNEEGKKPQDINYYDFINNKLRTIIDKLYGSSSKKAVMDAIDNLY